MVSYDDLFQVCIKYTAADYFIGDVIPEKKLVNVRKRYPVPDQERIVALLDTTVFGSAKTGLAIGETGLHWRNASVETNRTYISWHEFASVPITTKGILPPPKIAMGKDAVVELLGSGLSKDDVVKLLTDLQYLIRSPSSASRSPSTTDVGEQWMLAVNDKQYGPYDLPTVRGMVVEGQINASECWAWKEGMAKWERFTQVPTLAALLRGTSRPPTMPPPLPSSASPAPANIRPKEQIPQSPIHPVPHNHTVSYDELFQVCVKYSGDGYYVGETISQKKLTNARSSFRIPDTEMVVALLDATAFGSSKDGLAVCTGGVYWHNMLSEPKNLLWAEFISADVKPKGKRDLEIGEGNEVQLLTNTMDRDDALRLLSEIQMLISTSSTARGSTGDLPSTRVPEDVEKTSSRPPEGDTATRVSPQIDLNHAPVDDLLSLPAISLPNSQKLIKERELRAGFDTVEEAGHFLSLQPHQVERLKQRVTVEPYRGTRPSSGRVIDF